jgi:hypothetical protein
MAMRKPTAPHKPHASPWAVGLFLISSGFAVLSIALFWTSYSPF